MREIKFRVWDDHFKYMNYKVTVGMWGKESLNDDNYTACAMYVMPDKVDYKCEPHWAHFEPYMEDVHLMQYTGIKDKNGKEIYEGDILKINVAGVINKRVKVVYENGAFGVYWKAWGAPREELHYFNSFCNTEFEVIGNIYENPELLGDD